MKLRPLPLLAMLLPMASGACTPSAEVRYRVSYTVDDNGITRSSSGVWSNTVRKAAIPLADKYEYSFQGEAIPINLPRRGILLLMPIGQQNSDADAITLIRKLFSDMAIAGNDDSVGNTRAIAENVGKSRSIPCKNYKILKTMGDMGEIYNNLCLEFAFVTDPADPATFQHTTVRHGHFEGITGVRLRDAHVTVTRDPVTRGLEQVLPWIPKMQKYWNDRIITKSDRKKHAYEMIYIRR